MTAQIIALPQRSRNPQRNHTDASALIAYIKGAPKPGAVKSAFYLRACQILHELAREWGLDITINGPRAGGAS